MQVVFYKYQGTGNDFVMIDNRKQTLKAQDNQLISRLCDRRFGIGADGLILVENMQAYDFKMIYFNANGRKGSMCGNGGRCAVKFAQDLGIIRNKTKFIAVDGKHEAELKDGLVYLKMGKVSPIESISQDYFLDTGSPHYVRWVEDLEHYKVTEEGRKVRYSERFERQGTNVNFIEQISEDKLFVRTYERGVEAETYSCGTGVTAAALIAQQKGLKSPISIKTIGGNLEVSFEKKGNGFDNIFLAGPAERVFEGKISTNSIL